MSNVPAKQTPPQPIDTLRNYLERSKAQLAYALPKFMSPERTLRMAITVVQRTPALLDCTPLSIVGCVMQAAELGLELSGSLGQAWMVPYKNTKRKCVEATFQIGYRGYIALAYRSRQVSFFNAHEVCENDEFEYEHGLAPKLVHRPALVNRGKVIAYYAMFKLKDGAGDFEVMSAEEMLAFRNKYSRKPLYGPWLWETNPVEMGKKTVIRRLAKRAPISIDLVGAAELDEREMQGGLAMEAKGRAILEGPGPTMEEYQQDEPSPEETVLPDGEVIDENKAVGASPVEPGPDAAGMAPGVATASSPADAPSPQPPSPPPAQPEGGALADLLSDLSDQVEMCETKKQFSEVKAELDRRLKDIGKKEHRKLVDRLDARWGARVPQEVK